MTPAERDKQTMQADAARREREQAADQARLRELDAETQRKRQIAARVEELRPAIEATLRTLGEQVRELYDLGAVVESTLGESIGAVFDGGMPWLTDALRGGLKHIRSSTTWARTAQGAWRRTQ